MKRPDDAVEIEMVADKDGTFLPVRQYSIKEKEKKEKKEKRIKMMKQQNDRYNNVSTDTNNTHTIHATVNQFMEGLTIGLNVLQKFQRIIR